MTTAYIDLPAALIGYDETLDAERHRVFGIDRVQDALDDQRLLPAVAVARALPRQRASA